MVLKKSLSRERYFGRIYERGESIKAQNISRIYERKFLVSKFST